MTVTADKYINKGPSRPIFNQYLRAEMIASLSYVDYVGVIEEPSAMSAIRAIRPHIYVKGIDYKDKSKDITKKYLTKKTKLKNMEEF